MSVKQGLNPWSDSNELKTVFNSIYQNKDSIDFDYELLFFAKNKITIWLTRIQHNIDVSVSLMATKEIINALMADNDNTKREEELRDDSSVYSLYALSVIRFCSVISNYSHEDNMKSVRRLAHRYSCPQWIIDCRHSLCHSSANQPSMKELRTAALIGLNWLRQYFWTQVCHQLRDDYNCDYFKLIERHISLENKSKQKTKNEIIIGLKYKRNELISSLIQSLITNGDKSRNYESLRVPKLYLKKYSNIFGLIIANNCLSIVLTLMVRYFDCEDRCRQHLAMSWFSTLIKSIECEKRVSKFKRNFNGLTFLSVMPKIQWIRLLYSIVKRPNPNTPALIQLIAPIVSDVIPEKKIEILLNLSKHYSCEALNEITDSKESLIGKEFTVKTVNDLMAVSSDESVGTDLQIRDPIDWSEISFGANVGLNSCKDFIEINSKCD